MTTSDGQRFRLLRQHARGGLGEVFVALDAELHREVALKQIRDAHADDPVSRQRFVAEAEITGALEHPGIVPVYGLGTYGSGRPYYAMRFIRGGSLKEAIERFHGDDALKNNPGRRSLELRKLLRRFLDVCNAIDYAHSRGVIHRDLKPANIVLGRHGETLVVDWGLAKAVGRADPSSGEQTIAPSSSGSSETLPGSALGTPAYMSPEQAGGELDRLGPRSDVYSLGATLYCLLTGRPPFEGDDIGAILRRVQAGDVRAPREVDAALDRALEAVCLKAMATQPADRYATGRALAEDVERWAADEPVSAWREPLSRRVRRWAKRNRTAVASAAVALIAGVVGLSAVLAVQTKAKAEVTRALSGERDANRALAASNKALERSKAAVQARYDLAVDAIRTFHTGVSEDFLLKQEQFKDQRDRLLKSASDFYRKLVTLLGKETDITARRALAASNFELAGLMRTVGRKEEALAVHRAVLAAREALATEPGAGAGAKVDVGESLHAVATLLEETGATGEALAAFRRSESLLAGLAGADPSARSALAGARARIGYLLDLAGDLGAARAAHEAAMADRRALAAAHPDGIKEAVDLAYGLDVYGHFQQATGQMSEALASFREGRAIIDRAAKAEPAVMSHRSLLAHLIGHVADLLLKAGNYSQAEAELRAALAIQQNLADANPAVTSFQHALAGGYSGLGHVLRITGKPAEALAGFRKALVISQMLADANPAATSFQMYVAGSYNNIGLVLSRTGNPSGALEAQRKALSIRQRLVDTDPAATSHKSDLAWCHIEIGQLLLRTGKPVEALEEYVKALSIRRKLADASPGNAGFLGHVARCHIEIGRVHAREKRFAEAFTAFDTGLAIYQKSAGSDPKNTDYANGLSFSYAYRGWARVRAGQPAEAAADLRRAIELWARLPHLDPDTKFERAQALALLAGLGKDPNSGVTAAEAASSADQAVAGLADVVKAGWNHPSELKDPDFDALRGREDFKKLVAEAEAKHGPKAKPKD